jgi:hypothetical protein
MRAVSYNYNFTSITFLFFLLSSGINPNTWFSMEASIEEESKKYFSLLLQEVNIIVTNVYLLNKK